MPITLHVFHFQNLTRKNWIPACQSGPSLLLGIPNGPPCFCDIVTRPLKTVISGFIPAPCCRGRGETWGGGDWGGRKVVRCSILSEIFFTWITFYSCRRNVMVHIAVILGGYVGSVVCWTNCRWICFMINISLWCPVLYLGLCLTVSGNKTGTCRINHTASKGTLFKSLGMPISSLCLSIIWPSKM